MSAEFKPGDVALVDSWRGEGQIAFRCERILNEPTWCVLDGTDTRGLDDHEITNARRLVVIDPEDREAVEDVFRLVLKTLPKVGPTHRDYCDAMQAALREFADPPKPEEPTGHLAVVEDGDGVRWVNWRDPRDGTVAHERPWQSAAMDADEWRDYADIAAVTVLSEGVPS